jgi:hypothetical protein
MREACCAHERSCQPSTIAGLDAPSAMSTLLPVKDATDDAPSARLTVLRTPSASGPSFWRKPGTRCPTAVANAKAS